MWRLYYPEQTERPEKRPRSARGSVCSTPLLSLAVVWFPGVTQAEPIGSGAVLSSRRLLGVGGGSGDIVWCADLAVS